MKTLLLLLLLIEPVDIGTINKDSGIAISHCHPGHLATIHVVGRNDTEGFKTDSEFLTLKDLSMLPDGTNIFEIRSICQGVTGEVSIVQFNLQRPPPKPKIVRRRINPPAIPPPPIPAGLVMPLPGGTNLTYGEYVNRMMTGKRRNQ